MQSAHPPLDDITFGAVIVAVRAGDERALGLLFADLHPRLLRFLRASEPTAADDIASDVWLAVARGIGRFDGSLADFCGWVFSIAKRRLADHRRTSVRRATSPVGPDFFNERSTPGSASELISDRFSAQDAVDLIARHLPSDQAELLTLRIVADLDVAHVAAVMDRSPNWVRVTQHRALRRLAAALAVPLEKNLEDPVIPFDAETIFHS